MSLEKGGANMRFEKVYTVKKEYSKEDFLRQLLIDLATPEHSPADIVNCKFEEVQEVYREVLSCTAHFECDLSCTIGDKYKGYNNQINWRYKAFFEHQSHDVQLTAFNKELHTSQKPGFSLYEGSLSYCTSYWIPTEDKLVEEGRAQVSKSVLDGLRSEIMEKVDMPYADSVSDVNIDNIDISYIKMTCYLVPIYIVYFEYNGERYQAMGKAYGEMLLRHESVLPIKLSEYEEDKEIEKKCEEKVKLFKTAVKISDLAFIAFSIGAFVLCASGNAWFWIFALISVGAAVAFNILRARKYKAEIDEIDTKITDEIKRFYSDKYSLLVKSLEKHELKPLDKEESKIFKDYLAVSVPKRESITISKTGIIIRVVALIIVIAISMGVAIPIHKAKKSAAVHTPDQVVVTVSNKSQEYIYSDLLYADKYFVYLEYSITSKDFGIDRLYLETAVYQNDVLLGTINTPLSSMKLEQNSNQVYKTELGEYSLDKSTFFKTLYESNYSDLTFAVTIKQIDFNDGAKYKAE